MAYLTRLILLLLLLWSHPYARAQISYSGNVGSVAGPAINTLNGSAGFERFMRNVTGSSLDVVDRASGKIGGKTFPVDLTRTIPKSGLITAMARGAKALASRTVQGLIITTAAAAAFCKYSTGSWRCDPMESPVPQDLWVCEMAGSAIAGAFKAYGISASDACYGSFLKYQIANTRTQSFSGGLCVASYSYSYGGFSNGVYQVMETVSSTNGCAGGSTPHLATSGTPSRTTATVCRAVSTDGYAYPGGAPDSNGKCPTGTYADASESDVTTRVGPKIQTAADVEKLGRDLIGSGIDVAPYASPLPGTLSGPASVTQAPTTTTTTSPTGSPQTTTTQTTNYITYNQNTFTWNNSTTTVKPDGTTDTTTETPEEQKSECEKNPEAIGCQKTDVPDVGDLQTKEKQVSWSPDSGWGADNAACPAKPNLSVLGVPITIDNTIFCGFFSGIRFAVIGISAVAAAFIFIGGVKQ